MGIKDKFFLDAGNSALVIIDVQEKLCRAMDEKVLRHLVANAGILMDAAAELKIPTIVTEQYVKGLGETLPELKERSAAPAFEKMTFSCCGDAAFIEKMKSLGKKQVIIAGMECHVCVLQTVIELLDAGFIVHLVRDAVMSRRKDNWFVGLEAARDAGAVITSTEAALFQLLKVAGTEEFKKLSKLVR
jgi:nicotinamidase-related amidase